MNYRVLGSVAAAAAIAFAQPVVYLAQEANRALEIIAAARKAIGDKKLDALTTFSLQSSLQRNIGDRQMNSDVEIVLDLPDKYLRQETPVGGGMMVTAGGLSGFSGDRPLQKVNGGSLPGGGMIIRMGGPGIPGSGEKPTAEQLAEMNRRLVRSSQTDASRLMLGWFATAHPAANVQYTYAGEAESPDGKAFVIDVKNADNFNARLFIDQQTSLPLLVTYKGPMPRVMTSGGQTMTAAPQGGGHVVPQAPAGRQMTDEERAKAMADAEKQLQEMQRQPPALVDFALYFEEWREAEGLKFPFKMRRATAGATTEEWTVSRIKVNPKVDAKRFTGES